MYFQRGGRNPMKKTKERLTKPQKTALGQIYELNSEIENRLFTIGELRKVTESTLNALERKKYLKSTRLFWNKDVVYYQWTGKEEK